MRPLNRLAVPSAAVLVVGAITGCASETVTDLQPGDCLRVGGTPERPETTQFECGSPESNFRVAAVVEDSKQCPADVDSYFTMRSAFADSGTTVCMDIDWVIGGCMSIPPTGEHDPVRADCSDTSAPHRQRATQILRDVASVDECTSGLGYAYEQREFTVCVENVS